MKESMKKGFGFTVGVYFAGGLILYGYEKLMKWAAGNEKLMNKFESEDQEFHEKLKKYQK